MTKTTEPRMRPLALDPTPEYDALMDAIDAWIHVAKPTWREGDEALAAMFRAVHYADSACNECSRSVDDYNWPYRIERGAPGEIMWRATYRCRACSCHYSCHWADLDELLCW